MEETISQSFSHSRAPSDCMASASHFVRTRPNHAVRTQQTRPEISEINWRLLTILLHLPRSLAVHHGVDSIASRAAAFAVLALIMRVVIASIAMSPGRAEACMRYGNTCATFLITGQQDVNKPVPGPGARWGASSPPPPLLFFAFPSPSPSHSLSPPFLPSSLTSPHSLPYTFLSPHPLPFSSLK